jgi:predicted PurR-regulated permease PerM
MPGLLAGLLAIIVEAIAKVFASKFFMKAIMSASVYVFLFAIIPLLIQFLVPDSIMHAASSYADMLNGGASTLACSGTVAIADHGPSQSLSCNTTVTMVAFGQGVLYFLNFMQFTSLVGVMLPVLAITFLFKRI